ncbi:MAG: ATP-binding protein [Nodosilinea sp. LVE1205-7]
MPELPTWQGRELELARLADWLTVDRCRLIAVTGLVGTGKTALVARLIRSLPPMPLGWCGGTPCRCWG